MFHELKATPLALACLFGFVSQAPAQPPQRQPATKNGSEASIVTRLLAFDKNGDGQLTIDEITDTRLHRLFERADANKDGIVTKEELTALAKTLEAEIGQGGGRGGPGGGPPDGGPGRRGQRGQRGPGGPPDGEPGMRGPGGFGARPQPGQILPVMVQDRLGLSAEQKTEMQALQKDVDAKMAKILTADQQKQLKELQNDFGPPGGRGRGGPGRGGPGGRGGPPGGDPDGPQGGPDR